MRTLIATLVFVLLAGTFSFAHNTQSAQSNDPLVKTKEAVQSAALVSDAAPLKAARDLALSTVSTSLRKAVALYYVGYANYSLSVLPTEKANSEQHADAGIAAMEEAIKLDPTFAWDGQRRGRIQLITVCAPQLQHNPAYHAAMHKAMAALDFARLAALLGLADPEVPGSASHRSR